MLQKIEEIRAEVQQLTATTPEEAEQLRIKYLSKKGQVTMLMEQFRNVPAEQKRELGKKINELKQFTQDKINSLKEQVATTLASGPQIDLTRSPYPIPHSPRHTSPPLHRKERNRRHILTSRLYHGRRSRSRRRLARI